MNGVDMVTVAKLLGHALVEAADRVSNRIHTTPGGKAEQTNKEENHADR